MKKTLRDYAAQIRNATTKDELTAISYDALKNDPECNVFSKKYDKIIDMCIQRERDLPCSQEITKKKPPLSERILAAENLRNHQLKPAPQGLASRR